MSSGESIFDRLVKVLADQLSLNTKDVTLTSTLGDDLGADSLDRVEVLMAIEEEFGLKIPDDDAEKFSAVGDIVKYLERHKSQ
jgi:acyl carrier protein